MAEVGVNTPVTLSPNEHESDRISRNANSGSFGVAISNAIRIHFEFNTNSLRMTANIRFPPL